MQNDTGCMRDITKEIEPLHKLFCGMTGEHTVLTMGRMHAWEMFLARKFTGEDLAHVIVRIKRGIRNGERRQGALRFKNLIEGESLEREFEETLAQARKEQRPVKQLDAGKASVLRQSGRSSETESANARSAAELIEQNKEMARLLKRFREQEL
jgi:hypothetical protein